MLTEKQAFDIYKKAKEKPMVACGTFKDCYHYHNKRAGENYAVLIENIDLVESELDEALAENNKLMNLSATLIKRKALTPEIFYSGAIGSKPLVIKEMIGGSPLAFRGIHKKDALKFYCIENGLSTPETPAERIAIEAMLQQYNLSSITEVAGMKDGIIEQFFSDVVLYENFCLELDSNPDNYRKTKCGLYTFDPHNSGSVEERPSTTETLQASYQTMNEILLSGITGIPCTDELAKEIQNKCSKAAKQYGLKDLPEIRRDTV